MEAIQEGVSGPGDPAKTLSEISMRGREVSLVQFCKRVTVEGNVKWWKIGSVV